MDTSLVSNPVYQQIQEAPRMGAEYIKSTILYANKYSDMEVVPMSGELKDLFTQYTHPTTKFNFRTQLEAILEKYDGDHGPWYIDGINGILHIHNRRIAQPGFFYRYQDENGEVLEVQVTTNWTTGTSSGTRSSEFGPNKEGSGGDAPTHEVELFSIPEGESFEAKRDTTSSLYGWGFGSIYGSSAEGEILAKAQGINQQYQIIGADGKLFYGTKEQYEANQEKYELKEASWKDTTDAYTKNGYSSLSNEAASDLGKELWKKTSLNDANYNEKIWVIRDKKQAGKPLTDEEVKLWQSWYDEVASKNYVQLPGIYTSKNTNYRYTNTLKVNPNQITFKRFYRGNYGNDYRLTSKKVHLQANETRTCSGTEDQIMKQLENAGVDDKTQERIKNLINAENESLKRGAGENNRLYPDKNRTQYNLSISGDGTIQIYSNLIGQQIQLSKCSDTVDYITSNPHSNDPTVNAILGGRAFLNTLKNRVVKQKHKEIQVQMKVIGRPMLQAGQAINIWNIGNKYSGTWNIKTCTHSLTNSSGYICTLVLKKLASGGEGSLITMSNRDPNTNTTTFSQYVFNIDNNRKVRFDELPWESQLAIRQRAEAGTLTKVALTNIVLYGVTVEYGKDAYGTTINYRINNSIRGLKNKNPKQDN